MKHLEELENKVLQVIQKNRDLQRQVQELEQENVALKEQKQLMETSLLRENASLQALSEEKNALKGSIDALLSNISSLEEAH